MIYDEPIDNKSNSRGSKVRLDVWFTHEGKIVRACVKVEFYIG